MPTIRVEHSKNYTCIVNSAIRDSRLSFKARGLHHLLLSYPDGWQVKIEHLVTESQEDGRTAIASALTELEKAGYLTRQVVINPETRLITGWESVIREIPIPDEENPKLRKSEKQKTRKSENPKNGKPDLRETVHIINTDSDQVQKEEDAQARSAAPSLSSAKTSSTDLNSHGQSFRITPSDQTEATSTQTNTPIPEDQSSAAAPRQVEVKPITDNYNASARNDRLFRPEPLPPYRLSKSEFRAEFIEYWQQELGKSPEWREKRKEMPLLGDAKRSLSRMDRMTPEEVQGAWEAFLERSEKKEAAIAQRQALIAEERPVCTGKNAMSTEELREHLRKQAEIAKLKKFSRKG